MAPLFSLTLVCLLFNQKYQAHGADFWKRQATDDSQGGPTEKGPHYNTHQDELPDATAVVGHLFKYEIPRNIFSGDVNLMKVSEAGSSHLPEWLYFDESKLKLFGVPSPLDQGGVALVVKAMVKERSGNKTAHEESSLSLVIIVKSVGFLNMQRDSASSCNWDENPVRGRLFLNAKFHAITAERRVNLINIASSFLSHEPADIFLGPELRQAVASLLNERVLASGSGTTRKCEGNGVELSWPVGCGQVFLVNDFATILEHNIQTGLFKKILGYEINSWGISEIPLSSSPNRLARKRRAIMQTPLQTPSIMATMPSKFTETSSIMPSGVTTEETFLELSPSPSFRTLSSSTVLEPSVTTMGFSDTWSATAELEDASSLIITDRLSSEPISPSTHYLDFTETPLAPTHSSSQSSSDHESTTWIDPIIEATSGIHDVDSTLYSPTFITDRGTTSHFRTETSSVDIAITRTFIPSELIEPTTVNLEAEENLNSLSPSNTSVTDEPSSFTVESSKYIHQTPVFVPMESVVSTTDITIKFSSTDHYFLEPSTISESELSLLPSETSLINTMSDLPSSVSTVSVFANDEDTWSFLTSDAVNTLSILASQMNTVSMSGGDTLDTVSPLASEKIDDVFTSGATSSGSLLASDEYTVSLLATDAVNMISVLPSDTQSLLMSDAVKPTSISPSDTLSLLTTEEALPNYMITDSLLESDAVNMISVLPSDTQSLLMSDAVKPTSISPSDTQPLLTTDEALPNYMNTDSLLASDAVNTVPVLQSDINTQSLLMSDAVKPTSISPSDTQSLLTTDEALPNYMNTDSLLASDAVNTVSVLQNDINTQSLLMSDAVKPTSISPSDTQSLLTTDEALPNYTNTDSLLASDAVNTVSVLQSDINTQSLLMSDAVKPTAVFPSDTLTWLRSEEVLPNFMNTDSLFTSEPVNRVSVLPSDINMHSLLATDTLNTVSVLPSDINTESLLTSDLVNTTSAFPSDAQSLLTTDEVLPNYMNTHSLVAPDAVNTISALPDDINTQSLLASDIVNTISVLPSDLITQSLLVSSPINTASVLTNDVNRVSIFTSVGNTVPLNDTDLPSSRPYMGSTITHINETSQPPTIAQTEQASDYSVLATGSADLTQVSPVSEMPSVETLEPVESHITSVPIFVEPTSTYEEIQSSSHFPDSSLNLTSMQSASLGQESFTLSPPLSTVSSVNEGDLFTSVGQAGTHTLTVSTAPLPSILTEIPSENIRPTYSRNISSETFITVPGNTLATIATPVQTSVDIQDASSKREFEPSNLSTSSVNSSLSETSTVRYTTESSSLTGTILSEPQDSFFLSASSSPSYLVTSAVVEPTQLLPSIQPSFSDSVKLSSVQYESSLHSAFISVVTTTAVVESTSTHIPTTTTTTTKTTTDSLPSSKQNVTTSSTPTPSTDPVKITVTPVNTPPRLVKPIDIIEIILGVYFEYIIPEDTFFDDEDGTTKALKLRLDTLTQGLPRANSWLQLDAPSRKLYGIRTDNIASVTEERFLLIAQDSGGLIAQDFLKIVINISSWENVSHQFHVTLYDERKEDTRLDKVIYFVHALGNYFGDNTPRNITVTGVNKEATELWWTNNTLSKISCDNRTIHDLFSMLVMVVNNSQKFSNALTPRLDVLAASVQYLGVCAPSANATIDRVLAPVVDNSIYYKIFIPICVILLILLICLLCYLYHSRRQKLGGKLLFEDEKPVFKIDRHPILLEHELELQYIDNPSNIPYRYKHGILNGGACAYDDLRVPGYQIAPDYLKRSRADEGIYEELPPDIDDINDVYSKPPPVYRFPPPYSS